MRFVIPLNDLTWTWIAMNYQLKEDRFFMTGRKRVEWWRLVPSFTIINECPVLELSMAWKPSDRIGAW